MRVVSCVSLSVAFSIVVLTLGGCAMNLGLPDVGVGNASASPAALPGIQGSNYGGHAPLVGAHVYVVQPGTTGYGSLVTGLLSATYNTNVSQTGGVMTYPTTLNGTWTNSGFATDQFVPAVDAAGKPFYGVTTDKNGEFNITGDYTCTPGQPVMLIAYGGAPSYLGAGPNVYTVATEEAYNNGSTGVYLTYVTSYPTPQLFYVGESVTVSGAAGGGNVYNQTGTVLGSGFHFNGTAAPLSTTSFSIFVPYNATLTAATANAAPAAYGGGAVIATATPTFNPAAVNMAMLGNCPTTGNFTNPAGTVIKYIYMNEISTAAVAYAMNQYMNWNVSATVNDQAGVDEFHIGAPNTAQAQLGIANAAIAAANLYDIQGGNVALNNPDGDVHIARTVTPSGTGNVPQTMIDTIGNILAACVDSANTYRSGFGTISPSCQTLEQQAQDNGYVDTSATTHQAFNTAQAAFNLAHYPQSLGTATTVGGVYGGPQTYTKATAGTTANWATKVFNIPTGNVPFTPQLAAAPNDYSVAINWQTSSVSGTSANTALSGLALDGSGNVWVPAYAANKVFELYPNGQYSTYNPPTGRAVSNVDPGGIDIDTSGNVWVSGDSGTLKFVPLATAGTATGTVVGVGTSNNATQLQVDNSASPGPYLYIADANGAGFKNDGSTAYQLTKISSVTGTVQAGFPIRASTSPYTAGTAPNCVEEGSYVTLDANNNIWTSSNNTANSPFSQVCRLSSTGTLQYELTVPSGNPLPHSIAIDNGGNAWFADRDTPYLGKIAAGTSYIDNGTTNASKNGLTQSTAGGMSQPRGIAVDGANTIWVSNNTGGSVEQFTNADATLTPTALVSSGSGQTDYSYVSVDISGNVWAVEVGGQIVEYVGLGAPTVMPLSVARYSGKLGATP